MANLDILQSVTYPETEHDANEQAREAQIGLMGREATTRAHWVNAVRANIQAADLSDEWGVNASGVYRKTAQEETA